MNTCGQGWQFLPHPRKNPEISVEITAPEEICFFRPYWKKWKKLKIGVIYLFLHMLHLDCIPQKKTLNES